MLKSSVDSKTLRPYQYNIVCTNNRQQKLILVEASEISCSDNYDPFSELWSMFCRNFVCFRMLSFLLNSDVVMNTDIVIYIKVFNIIYMNCMWIYFQFLWQLHGTCKCKASWSSDKSSGGEWLSFLIFWKYILKRMIQNYHNQGYI